MLLKTKRIDVPACLSKQLEFDHVKEETGRHNLHRNPQKEGLRMNDQLLPAFVHRHNHEDGSWDLICAKCFLTVATEKREDDLFQHEQEHNCEALRGERRKAGILEPIRGPRL
jgi:hypothetical protein